MSQDKQVLSNIFANKFSIMDVNDIEEKQDNELKKRIIERLNIPSFETLSAKEINAIVDFIKNHQDIELPNIEEDPLETYYLSLNS